MIPNIYDCASSKTEKRYLANPFDRLYQDKSEVSDKPEIQELIEYATGLEEKIEGDFEKNLEYELFDFRYNQLAFVRNGLLLAKIKFWKLYKNIGDGTFASFCKEQLHKTRWQINDTITSAKIVLELVYQGFEILPTNISQAIALKGLTEEELYQAWKQVTESITPSEITHKSIRTLLFPPTEQDKAIATIKVPATLHEEIHDEAANQGLSITQLIKTMLEFFISGGNSHLFEEEENDIPDDKKEELWQQDLAELAKIKNNDYNNETILKPDKK